MLRGRALIGLIAAVLGIASIPAVSAIAQPSGGESETARASRAQADAEGLLSDLRLPEGAQLASSDPSVGQGLTVSSVFASAPGPGQAYADRFWRVPGEPQEVITWIETHVPAAARVSLFSRPPSDVGFRFRPRPSGVTYEEQLLVAALRAEGGGTALRAQGQVVWFPVRPPSERLPSGVKLIQIVKFSRGESRVSKTIRSLRLCRAWSPQSKPSSAR